MLGANTCPPGCSTLRNCPFSVARHCRCWQGLREFESLSQCMVRACPVLQSSGKDLRRMDDAKPFHKGMVGLLIWQTCLACCTIEITICLASVSGRPVLSMPCSRHEGRHAFHSLILKLTGTAWHRGMGLGLADWFSAMSMRCSTICDSRSQNQGKRVEEQP